MPPGGPIWSFFGMFADVPGRPNSLFSRPGHAFLVSGLAGGSLA